MPQMEQIFRARSLGILQRAAVPAATTTDPAWAGTLVYANQLSSELIELVMPETVLGQLEGMRRVPFNVRIPRETAMIAHAKWVGQSQSKPVGKGAFDFLLVPYTKAALIVLLTEELARFSDPSAELLMRNGLVRELSRFLDTEFLSTTAAVPNVSPGGILAGLPAAQMFASSGSGWEHILWDATNAINLLTTGLVAPRRPTWIMSPANRTAVGFLPNAFGVSAFPSVTAQGTLAGLPIITSQNVPNNIVLLIDADMLLHASDPSIRLDISREASVEASDTPGTPPTGMVSLWQQNLIGILAEKYEWWGRARDQAIVEITGVAWATAPAPISAPINPTAAAARTAVTPPGGSRTK
jgi:HK97 family phage major capsid protein